MLKNTLRAMPDSPQFMDELMAKAAKYIDTNHLDNTTISHLGVELSFSSNLGNTHSAPFGKPTNWHQRDMMPKNYPGWHGRVWVATFKKPAYVRDNPFTMSNVLSKLGINTGSGGAGSYRLSHEVYLPPLRNYPNIYKYGWDVKIWKDDWPEIVLNSVLSVPSLFTISNVFWYNSPIHNLVLPNSIAASG